MEKSIGEASAKRSGHSTQTSRAETHLHYSSTRIFIFFYSLLVNIQQKTET